MKKEILIIGGGASGMVAAITAARKGACVTLVEQKNELGKKLLATGNGRCNFTNLVMDSDCFYTENTDKKFIDSLLERYTPHVIMDFFESIGVLAKERNGYVYPMSDQASSIRDALVTELEVLGVKIYLNTAVVGLKDRNASYEVQLEEQGESHKRFHVKVQSIILSTGGKSGLNKQTKFDGYSLLKDTKHHTTTLSPALVPLIGQGKFYKKIAGIRTDARITAKVNNVVVGSEVGEVQLTDYGISGIPVFQLSRIITQELKAGKKGSELGIALDFMPNYGIDELEQLFIERQKQFSGRTMKIFLNGILKDKLAAFLLYTARIDVNEFVENVREEDLRKLARITKTFLVKIEGCKDFPQAQVTAGGVPLAEVDNNLESIYHKNIYIIGELLDVDGICGGYNLHFAWATGLLVGTECSK